MAFENVGILAATSAVGAGAVAAVTAFIAEQTKAGLLELVGCTVVDTMRAIEQLSGDAGQAEVFADIRAGATGRLTTYSRYR